MLVALAQREIVEYLKAMPEGNQVAIFSLSYAGLKVLQGFTSDRALLLRCMDANFLVLGPNGEVIRRDWATIDALNQIAAYVSGSRAARTCSGSPPSCLSSSPATAATNGASPTASRSPMRPT
jgi:hypothetical protein